MLVQVTEKNGREFLLNTDDISMVDDLIDDVNYKTVGATVTFRGTDESLDIEETVTELSKTTGAKIVRAGATVK